jgi:hypothetical protein
MHTHKPNLDSVHIASTCVQGILSRDGNNAFEYGAERLLYDKNATIPDSSVAVIVDEMLQ